MSKAKAAKRTPGEILRAARRRSQKTQSQMAAIIGVAQSTISGLESDRHAPKNLRRVADAYGVPVEDLVP